MSITVIPDYDTKALLQQAAALLNENSAFATLTPFQKMLYFSERFLARAYLAGALGEGEQGVFDQSPPFRFDAFDCLTYVNTVLALALSQTVEDFTQHMLRLNYYDAQPDYLKRYHFMSLDWNVQNQQSKYLKDITVSIVDENGSPFFATAFAELNKSAWLLKRNISDLRLLAKAQIDATRLLQQLGHASSQFKAQTVGINYLPLTALFTQQGLPKEAIFKQIPDGSIVEIVRPNWDVSARIGTRLHVSHLGFAVRVNDVLLFRHASSEAAHVVQVSLQDYLYQRINSPTIKGISVFTLY